MHVLDLVEDSFQHAPGASERVSERSNIRKQMLKTHPIPFASRPAPDNADTKSFRIYRNMREMKAAVYDLPKQTVQTAERAIAAVAEPVRKLMYSNAPPGKHCSCDEPLGWRCLQAPIVQDMKRGNEGSLHLARSMTAPPGLFMVAVTESSATDDAGSDVSDGAWSIAY